MENSNYFLEKTTKQSRAVVVNPNKVSYLGIDLGYMISNSFKESAESLRYINLKKLADKVIIEFVFDTKAEHFIRVDFEEVTAGNYLYTMLADSKGIRIKARVRDVDDQGLQLFFQKLDRALSLIDKKYILDEFFDFNNHKEVVNLLDAISKLIIY